MKTKERIAEASGRKCADLVCPSCGDDKFHVSVQDINAGTHAHINAYCDCGYGISFNFNTRHEVENIVCIVAEAVE